MKSFKHTILSELLSKAQLNTTWTLVELGPKFAYYPSTRCQANISKVFHKASKQTYETCNRREKLQYLQGISKCHIIEQKTKAYSNKYQTINNKQQMTGNDIVQVTRYQISSEVWSSESSDKHDIPYKISNIKYQVPSITNIIS